MCPNVYATKHESRIRTSKFMRHLLPATQKSNRVIQCLQVYIIDEPCGHSKLDYSATSSYDCNVDEIRKDVTKIIDCLYRVTLKAIVINDKKLLMTREKEGFYSLPGGGLDYNEDFNEALERELLEELAVPKQKISIDQAPIHLSNSGRLNGIPRFHLYFRVKLKATDISRAELSYKWVDQSALKVIELSPDLNRAWLIKLLQ